MKIDPTVFLKLGTAFVSFCGAVYFTFSPDQHDSGHALTLFVGALATLGWTAEGVKSTADRATISEKQDEAAAERAEILVDTSNIRDNPAMPGTPK